MLRIKNLLKNFAHVMQGIKNPKIYLRLCILIMALIISQSQPILAGQSLIPGILMALSAYLAGELYLLQAKLKNIYRLLSYLTIFLLFLFILELPFLWVHHFSFPSLGLTIISSIIWILSRHPLIKEITGEKITHPHPSFRLYSITIFYIVFFIYFFFADKLNVAKILNYIIPDQLNSISFPPQLVIVIGFISVFVFILTLAGTIKITTEKRTELTSIAQKFFIAAMLLLIYEGFNFILEQHLVLDPDKFIFEQPFISYGLMFWSSMFSFLSSVMLLCLGLTDLVLLLGSLYENKPEKPLYQPYLIDEKKWLKK